MFGLPASMAVRFQKPVFQETRRSYHSIKALDWKLAHLYVRYIHVGKAATDSRKRDINPPLNGRCVREFVAIFNSPSYGANESSENLLKSMSTFSRNKYVQMY